MRATLAAQGGPAALARAFARAKLAELLETLAALGQARRLPDGRYLA